MSGFKDFMARMVMFKTTSPVFNSATPKKPRRTAPLWCVQKMIGGKAVNVGEGFHANTRSEARAEVKRRNGGKFPDGVALVKLRDWTVRAAA